MLFIKTGYNQLTTLIGAVTNFVSTPLVWLGYRTVRPLPGISVVKTETPSPEPKSSVGINQPVLQPTTMAIEVNAEPVSEHDVPAALSSDEAPPAKKVDTIKKGQYTKAERRIIKERKKSLTLTRREQQSLRDQEKYRKEVLADRPEDGAGIENWAQMLIMLWVCDPEKGRMALHNKAMGAIKRREQAKSTTTVTAVEPDPSSIKAKKSAKLKALQNQIALQKHQRTSHFAQQNPKLARQHKNIQASREEAEARIHGQKLQELEHNLFDLIKENVAHFHSGKTSDARLRILRTALSAAMAAIKDEPQTTVQPVAKKEGTTVKSKQAACTIPPAPQFRLPPPPPAPVFVPPPPVPPLLPAAGNKGAKHMGGINLHTDLSSALKNLKTPTQENSKKAEDPMQFMFNQIKAGTFSLKKVTPVTKSSDVQEVGVRKHEFKNHIGFDHLTNAKPKFFFSDEELKGMSYQHIVANQLLNAVKGKLKDVGKDDENFVTEFKADLTGVLINYHLVKCRVDEAVEHVYQIMQLDYRDWTLSSIDKIRSNLCSWVRGHVNEPKVENQPPTEAQQRPIT